MALVNGRGGITPDETAVPQPDARLNAYNRRTSKPLLVLGVGFLFLYAIPILWPSASGGLLLICEAVSYLIWLVFVADFVTRVYLAEHRWSYIGRHPIDLLVVALPALRPLRILRVFTAGQVILTRGREFAVGRTLAAAAGAGALITFIAALAELEAERGHAGANIETFREATWWAGVTITTVGYGDYYPVTPVGQAVAFALMIVGISLLGLVTATVATWFLTKVRVPAAREQEQVAAELRELRKQVAALSGAARSAPAGEQGDAVRELGRPVGPTQGVPPDRLLLSQLFRSFCPEAPLLPFIGLASETTPSRTGRTVTRTLTSSRHCGLGSFSARSCAGIGKALRDATLRGPERFAS